MKNTRCEKQLFLEKTGEGAFFMTLRDQSFSEGSLENCWFLKKTDGWPEGTQAPDLVCPSPHSVSAPSHSLDVFRRK